MAAYFALIYDVVDGFAEKRTAFRELHLGEIRAAHARGELALAGAMGEPIDGALLVFKGADASAAERFAREDPYVQRGLVKSWKVRPWHVVIGGDAG